MSSGSRSRLLLLLQLRISSYSTECVKCTHSTTRRKACNNLVHDKRYAATLKEKFDRITIRWMCPCAAVVVDCSPTHVILDNIDIYSYPRYILASC
ncbi:hypothetical protein BKA58DRAFT_384213 [Alternaria rosae]|uniref:uncharacterized protein n=1 Tax=Alternaria rosae TaxID=1187941 RepID=UPI001E8D2AF6|nr:uncharacterized protein BKA58DRAFT_384213 [Alternaria rosae]KAH6869990.1 hypothetical protein BKA58DRAFT_384213 [Alternaria rosae]